MGRAATSPHCQCQRRQPCQSSPAWLTPLTPLTVSPGQRRLPLHRLHPVDRLARGHRRNRLTPGGCAGLRRDRTQECQSDKGPCTTSNRPCIVVFLATDPAAEER